jgi:signal peptidase I
MANMFALILVIATLVTGVLWCLDKFIFAPKRRERQAAAQAATGELDKKDAEESRPETGLAGNRRIGFPGAGDRSGGTFIYL